MKEYIERAAAIEAIRKYQYPYGVEFLLSNMPAAYVVEVVRCQNCKHRIYKDMGYDIGMIGGCQVWGVALPGDFYCAHGVLMDKEDEHEQ